MASVFKINHLYPPQEKKRVVKVAKLDKTDSVKKRTKVIVF